MSVITHVPAPNLWDVICKDFASRRPPFKEDDELSVHTLLDDYDPTKHHPAFFGQMHERQEVDQELAEDFDPATSHPACIGYTFVKKPPVSPPPMLPPPPPKDKCSPREYLEHYVFPVLLPALEEMLKQAKLERCFERKRTKFNALDFLTEFMYKNNCGQEGREDLEFGDIPFVKEWWKEHPRPPLPMSLLWSEEEACLIIQSFYKGYLIRCEPDVGELRAWQREWQEENADVKDKVSEFWSQQMPEGEQETTLNDNTDNDNTDNDKDNSDPLPPMSPV